MAYCFKKKRAEPEGNMREKKKHLIFIEVFMAALNYGEFSKFTEAAQKKHGRCLSFHQRKPAEGNLGI